jgi:hypothetical protein
VNGNFDIKINSGEYNIFCEGNSAVGIGDCFGSGNVAVSGGVFKMHIAASTVPQKEKPLSQEAA